MAVFSDEEGNSNVWVVNQETSRVNSRVVEVGEVTGTESIEILGGLQSGEMIAKAGIRHLREDMKVKPRSEGEKITN